MKVNDLEQSGVVEVVHVRNETAKLCFPEEPKVVCSVAFYGDTLVLYQTTLLVQRFYYCPVPFSWERFKRYCLLSGEVVSDFVDKCLPKSVSEPNFKFSLRVLWLAVTNSSECFPQTVPVHLSCAVTLMH